MKLRLLLKTTALSALLLIAGKVGWGQATGDFRTKATGNWSAFATVWETYDGAVWNAATAVPTATSSVTISTGHTVTFDADATIANLIISGTTQFINATITGTPTGAVTSGSNVITGVSSTAGIKVGATISGTGIPTGTLVSAFDATTITLTANATASGASVTLTIVNGVSMTLTGDLTVKTGGAFNLGTQTNTPEHFLNIAGNIVLENASTLNVENGSTKGCTFVFNKTTADDQTISSTGTPTAVKFNKIKLTRTNSIDKVVCSVGFSIKAGGLALQFVKGTWEQTTGTISGPGTSGSATNLQFDQPNGRLVLSGNSSMTLSSSIIGIAGSNGFEGEIVINTDGTVTTGALNSNSRLQVSGGTLTIQKGTVITRGRLTISGTTNISGGNVTIYPQGVGSALGNTSNTFEIGSTGTLNMSGGSITIACPNAGSATGRTGRDLKIAGTLNMTGGTIYLGEIGNTKTCVTMTDITPNFAGFLVSGGGATIKNLVVQTDGLAGRDVGLTGDLAIENLTLTSGKLELRASGITIMNPISGTATNLLNTGNGGSMTIGGTVTGVNIPSSITGLTNLTVNNANGTTLQGNLALSGTCTLTNGGIILNSNTLTYGASVTLNYNGTVAQTTSDVEFPSTGGPLNLTINNAAGVNLHAARTVAGALTLTSGKLDIGANNLTINSVTGYDATKYFITSGAGFLKMNTLGAAGVVTYPIGPSATSYTPYISTDNTSTDVLGVNVKGSITNATLDNEKCVKLEWQASEGVGGGNNGTATFQWNAADQGTSFNPAQSVFLGTWDGAKYIVSAVSVAGTGPYTVTMAIPDVYPTTPVIFANAGAFPEADLPKGGKDFLTYTLAGVNATVNTTDHTVAITLPFSTNVTALVATFSLSDKATAKVGTVAQVSGTTPNDFTSPVTYTVTAEDFTTQNWVVTVTKAPVSTDATLSDIKVDGTTLTEFALGIFNYAVKLPVGTTAIPVVSATQTFGLAGVVITQATSLTGDIASRTATIVVTAEDGTTIKTYNIVFSISSAVVGDLFFSEYVEGSSNNKAFEIYNPTSSAINLSGYFVKSSNNGVGFGMVATTPAAVDTRYTLPLSGTIAPGDVYVVYNSAATAGNGIAAAGDLGLAYSGTVNDPVNLGANVPSFNGNDALGLFKGTTLIDVFGGELVSANFDVAGVVGAAVDHTIVRKPTKTSGNTDWAASAGTTADNSEWILYNVDVFTYLGSHTVVSTSPTVAVSATTLASFGSIVQGTVGVIEATFNVSGSNLTNNIVITAPAGFEISTVSGAGFVATSPITLTLTAGAVSSTPIYVKFHPTAVQEYTGKINISSLGITDKIVGVSGTGVASDNTAPAFVTGYPVSLNVGPYKFDVKVKVDEAGRVYYLKQAKDATAPTSAVVKSTGVKIDVPIANTEYTASITGLTNNTGYDIWFVAEDNQATPNLMDPPTKLTVTTIAVTTLSIHDIQYTTDASGDSPQVGKYVTTSGIVTAIKLSSTSVQQGYYIQNGTGEWNGLYVYSATPVVAVGDNITITGVVEEAFKSTQLTSIYSTTIVSSGNALPAAFAATTLACNNESFENVLVKVSRATCNNAGTGIFVVSDGTGNVTVYKGLFSTLSLTLNNKYDITGVVADYYTTSTSTHLYEIYPRNAADISDVTGINDEMVSKLSVYPNPFTNEIRFDATQNVKRIVITSITGQVMMNISVAAQANRIETDNLPKGMYIVTFMNSKGERVNHKMFKE